MVPRMLFWVFVVSSFNNHAFSSSEVETLLVSGMSIKTDNQSLQTVKVRGKSLGPGFCAVTIDGGGSSVGFSLPPGVDLPWAELFSPAVGPPGVTCYKITYEVGCDTGVLLKIKYLTDTKFDCQK